MEIEGNIIQILPQQKGSSSRGEWAKQDFILETQGQYPKKVCIAVWNNKFEVEPYLNKTVKVSINVESREYNEKWYTDVKAWKIESLSGGSTSEMPPQETQDINKINDEMQANSEEEMDDLPF